MCCASRSHSSLPPRSMMLLDSPSSSHTFLPLIPALSSRLLLCRSCPHFVFPQLFPSVLSARPPLLPSLWISACELLIFAGWQGNALNLRALVEEDNRQFLCFVMGWRIRRDCGRTGGFTAAACAKVHAVKRWTKVFHLN